MTAGCGTMQHSYVRFIGLIFVLLISSSQAFNEELTEKLMASKHDRIFRLHMWKDEANMPTCRAVGIPDDYSGRVEMRAKLFGCARSGLIVTVKNGVEKVTVAFAEGEACSKIERKSRYNEKRNRFESNFKDTELSLMAALAVRKTDELGFVWTLEGSDCQLSFIQEVMLDGNQKLIGMLGLRHNAILDAHESQRLTGEAPTCQDPEDPAY
eukprot:2349108-Rhodomonas_salina.1